MSGLQQAISYFFVGGISAIVEWAMFFIFSSLISLHYLLSTSLAFIFSTTTNWYLGRKWTFKENKNYAEKKAKELFLILLVSAVGLIFNIILMYFFVDILELNTDLQKILCKIAATGIVFIWNFLIRKCVVYK